MKGPQGFYCKETKSMYPLIWLCHLCNVLSWSMAYVTLLSPFSLWIFDKLRKLLLRLKPKRKPLFWHQRPMYKKWLLRRKQNLMLTKGIQIMCAPTIPKRKKILQKLILKTKRVEAPRQTSIHYSHCFLPLWKLRVPNFFQSILR